MLSLKFLSFPYYEILNEYYYFSPNCANRLDANLSTIVKRSTDKRCSTERRLSFRLTDLSREMELLKRWTKTEDRACERVARTSLRALCSHYGFAINSNPWETFVRHARTLHVETTCRFSKKKRILVDTIRIPKSNFTYAFFLHR